MSGSGRSLIHTNGVTISHWQGVFNTEDGQQVWFKGRDTSKNGRFIVLRTYFANSETLAWMYGLVCVLEGEFEPSIEVFKSIGYEWI